MISLGVPQSRANTDAPTRIAFARSSMLDLRSRSLKLLLAWIHWDIPVFVSKNAFRHMALPVHMVQWWDERLGA